MLEGSEVFLCRIRNAMAEEALLKNNLSMEELLRIAAPVVTTKETYFNLNGKVLGAWGEPKGKQKL